MYKEPFEVAQHSFLSLLKSNYPLGKLIVVLAIEERGGEFALNVSRAIERVFGDKFFKFMISRHPAGIPGEIAGKGSNDSWAVKEVKNKIIRMNLKFLMKELLYPFLMLILLFTLNFLAV